MSQLDEVVKYAKIVQFIKDYNIENATINDDLLNMILICVAVITSHHSKDVPSMSVGLFQSHNVKI